MWIAWASFWALAALLWFAFLFWAFARVVLRGPDLSRYDQPRQGQVSNRSTPSSEHTRVVATLTEFSRELEQVPKKERLAVMRRQLDAGFGSSRELDRDIRPAEADGVSGEWVLAPGASPGRRMLYLHGGAFMMGSTKSHRGLAAMMSRAAGAAVLVIDYRLMPEHPRRAGIEDSCRAYRWILDNGPEGPDRVQTLFVAGDSAGGNLTLMLLAWARDQRLRAADAAVALSPGTDTTFGSPSLRSNVASDPMLGPGFGKFLGMPRTLLLYFAWFTNRMRPCDPAISPIFGDLSGLPPVLVHASEAEMLRDDARRWFNKAAAAGSPAALETWPHMVHVWQAFAPEVPEAVEAWEHIANFLDKACASEIPASRS